MVPLRAAVPRWDDALQSNEESYWPQHSVLTHGKVYAGHTRAAEERITGILDWTTAAVGDPATDLIFHQTAHRDAAGAGLNPPAES